MISKLLNMLTKKTTTQQTTVAIEKNMDYYINDIQKILNIKLPNIQVIECFFATPKYVGGQKVFIESELPEDAILMGGYTLDEDGSIIIGEMVQYNDYENGRVVYKKLTKEEIIYILAHELRHAWQKQYHFDTYYQTNAVGDECVSDIAEIDADGFAIAYCFSGQADFSSNAMPFELNQVALQAELEGGQRWIRAHEIASELEFSNSEKIDAAKSNVNWNLVKKEITLLKLEGRFR